MASFEVDGRRQMMFATGIVDPVDEWADVQGKRTRTGGQDKSDDGVLLWGVEVTYREVAFGRASTATARVSVPSVDKPEPGFMSPIVFAGLVVEVSMPREGRVLQSRWRADAIAESTVGHGGAPDVVQAAKVPVQGQGQAGKSAEGGK